MSSQTNSGVFLYQEFKNRKSKNQSYSLRAFAKSIGMSPAALSLVFAGKRSLGLASLQKISDKLALNPEEKSKFFNLDAKREENETQLDMDTFKMIGDWYHLAILSLSHLKQSNANPKWIATMLQISEQEAKSALERLQKYGLIEVKGAHFKQIKRNVRIYPPGPSTAMQEFHRQNLVCANESLQNDPRDQRFFTSLTVATNKDAVENAKGTIDGFLRNLNLSLEKGNNHDRVYTVAVQMFPRSKLKDDL